MRLWTVNPSLLDTRGLVACWREGLLAKKCLEHYVQKKTCGYINHAQLIRFKYSGNPVDNINFYLYQLYKEAKHRGFNFDRSKLPNEIPKPTYIAVNIGQLDHELVLIRNKIEKRNPDKLPEFETKLTKGLTTDVEQLLNPLFMTRHINRIETWEKMTL